MELGFDPMSLLIQEGFKQRKGAMDMWANIFNDTINQWMTDIRMRNRVGKEAYKEGQKEAWKAQTGLDTTNAQKQIMAYNSAEAEKARQYEMYMTQNKYQMETQSMQEAGLNPAMVYGGGNLVPTHATGAEASAGMPQTSNAMGDVMDMIRNMSTLSAQVGLMNAQARLANSQADATEYGIGLTKEQTEGQSLNNEYLRDTMEDRKEGVKLVNDLTRSERRKIEGQLDEIVAHIDELIASAHEKEELAALHFAQRIVAKAQADEIVYLMPFKARLMTAQTSQAQNAAALSELYAMKEQKLIDDGYYDSLIDELKAQETSAEVKAEMDKIAAALRKGEFFTVDPNDPAAKQAFDKFRNKLFMALSVFNDNLNPISQTQFGSVSFSSSSNQSQGLTETNGYTGFSYK